MKKHLALLTICLLAGLPSCGKKTKSTQPKQAKSTVDFDAINFAEDIKNAENTKVEKF